jgi:hypothetical protein
MNTRIEEILDEGRFIILEDSLELFVNYYDRNEVKSWLNTVKINVVKEQDLFWPYIIMNLQNNNMIRARQAQNYSLVPKHKFDFETVEKIKKANISEIEPILPELFEWIEDINWPIARRLAVELVRFWEYIIQYVKYYLNHSTGIDEYCVFYEIMPLLKKTQLEALREDLERLATNPNEFEKDEEYDKFAKEYLNKIDSI